MSHSRQQGAREFYETLQRNKDAADRRILTSYRNDGSGSERPPTPSERLIIGTHFRMFAQQAINGLEHFA